MIAKAISLIVKSAGRLRRYLSEIVQWLGTPPLILVASSLLGLCAIYLQFAPCIEQLVRLSGMLFQLAGIILTAFGLRDTRRAFEDQPTSWGSIQAWWKRRPKLLPLHHVQASAAVALDAVTMSARARTKMGPNASLDERVAALESRYESLFDEVGRIGSELNHKTSELSRFIKRENRQRIEADGHIKDQLRKAVAEGLPLARTGVGFFFVGILFGTASPEIARFVGATACQ